MIFDLSKKSLTRFASLLSLVIAIILVCIKVWAWLETGSIALLTSIADSLVDVFASMVILTGIYYAQRPADHGHRYGHGKAEVTAAFVQALLLAVAGIVLGIESIYRVIIHQELSSQGISVYIMIAIIISTFCAILLVVIQTMVIKYTRSTAITADRVHYITDIVINIAVLCVLILERQFSCIRVDACVALAISCYMAWNAFSVIKSALLQLLDRELSSVERKRITEAVLNCYGVKKIHDLRTRNGGDRVFVELHVEVDGWLTVNAGHVICDNAEIAVKSLFAVAEVSVHLEPVGITDKRLDDLIK